MTSAQHHELTKPQSRKWVKASITSLSLIAALVGAFYLGSRHNVSPIGNAPQSAVTRDTPANVSKGADDANVPTGAARAPDAQGNDDADSSHDTHIAEMLSNMESDDHGVVSFVSSSEGRKVTMYCYDDVRIQLNGPVANIADLQNQIDDTLRIARTVAVPYDAIRHKQDIIAAMILLANAKKLLGDKAGTDEQVLLFLRENATDEDIGRALHQANQALVAAA